MYVVLFVVLVNAACICSFSRAEKALRDLGAAWVRALLTASVREAPMPPENDEPGEPQLARSPRRVLRAIRPAA